MSKAHLKKMLRREMRSRLEENCGDPVPVVEAILSHLAERQNVKTVAAYSALPGEVDVSALLEESGRSWVFPRVVGEDLIFHRVGDIQHDLLAGAYGILEPRADLPVVETEEIDLFLCPGLAFDRTGGRLGRGKGFYDRILANARPDAGKIGVCFSFQLVEIVHTEVHDIRMDAVIAG